MTDEAYREFAKDGVAELLAAADRRRGVARLRRIAVLRDASIEDSGAFAALGSRLDTIEHERGLPGNRIYYLAVPPSMFVPTVEQLARARFVPPPGSRAVRPADRRKADRPRSGERAGDQRRDRQGLRRAADLPDRSLPRQGDRPEHPGPAVRQQHLRAAVQSEVHRPRPDHRGRRGRRRHAGRLLRAGGRAARHGAEPPAPAPGARRDGAAVFARRGRRPRREARGPSVAAADRRRGGRRPGGAGAVRGRASIWARRCPAIATSLASPGARGRKPSSRSQLFIDNWRWAGVPFFLRTGKRLPKRASEISVQLKEVPPILFNRGSGRRRSTRTC